jgi:hypothetical protein
MPGLFFLLLELSVKQLLLLFALGAVFSQFLQ